MIYQLVFYNIWNNNNNIYFSYTATDVNFEQSTYSVYEDSGPVQLVLMLTNPSSTDLIIGVKLSDQQPSTTGMYIYMHTLYEQV